MPVVVEARARPSCRSRGRDDRRRSCRSARRSISPAGRARLRRVQDADIFRIDRGLHAERAADIAGQDAHLVGRRVRRCRAACSSGRTRPGCTNAASISRSSCRIRRSRRAARSRRPPGAVLTSGSFTTCAAAGEGGRHLVAVAVVIVERDIVRHVVVELRRAGLAPLRARVITAGSGSMSSDDRFGGVLGLRDASRATTQATGSPTKRTLSLASAGRGV